MDSVKQFLTQTRPRELSESIPSIDHCIWTARLLWEQFAASIREIISIDDWLFEKLNDLCLLMRSFIVLDDYLKDDPRANNEASLLTGWIDIIENRCIELIIEFSWANGINLWKEFKEKYLNAIDLNHTDSSFNIVKDKVAFLFLPFRLPFLSHKQWEKLSDLFSQFLFALQLCDDFSDIKEDSIVSHNKNIFLSNLRNPQDIQKIIEKKKYLAESLLAYIRNQMKQFSQTFNQSSIIQQYISFMIQWIDDRISSDIKPLATTPFSEFYFSIDMIPENWSEPGFPITDIEAPNINTIAK